jgi:hypothetical protein
VVDPVACAGSETVPLPPGTAHVHAVGGHPDPHLALRFTLKDALACIQTFSGSNEKNAPVIDNETFIAFNEWFEASVRQLNAAGVPASSYSSLLSQKLTGPIRMEFIRRQSHTGVVVATLPIEELRTILASFYHNATVRFTDSVVDMSFRKAHLAQDISLFRIYALHSTFATHLDRNQWIYRKLRAKMNAAWPSCLMHAATEFQLVLNPQSSFQDYVNDALLLNARRLQSQFSLSSAPSEAPKPSSSSRPSSSGTASAKLAPKRPAFQVAKKRSAPDVVGPSASPSKGPKLTALSPAAESALLKDHQRCERCAWNIAKDPKHPSDPTAKARRVEAIRHELARAAPKPSSA